MKSLKILLPLALCFVLLAGCGKKVELAGWEDYKDHPAQDVYAGEVAAPERIVMTWDGREKNTFDKGTETYEKIVSTLGQLIEAQLDENEQVKDLGRKLDGLKTMPELDKGVWLIYEYSADSYAPVYFEMLETQNSIVGVYSPAEGDGLTLHGFWSETEAQELLDYLNKQ